MSNHNYLNQEVKDAIAKVAANTLIELSIKDPPIDVVSIFDEESLNINFFDKEDPSFRQLALNIGVTKADLLRGILFVDRNLVLARNDGYERRTKWVLGHELGHWKLPWHIQILYKCTQFDLCHTARKQMEREANFYSGELLFLGDTFKEMLFYSQLSLDQIKSLANRFLMSKESTLR